MDLTLSHQKNSAIGWDISAAAKAEGKERITRAQILVNDSTEFDKTFGRPLNSWAQTITQKGQYPGENTVQLIITTDKPEDCEAEDSWS
jgi:hypothetical protein